MGKKGAGASEKGKRRGWMPLLVLLILSPVVGELLSGSSPPLEFFNPLALAFLVGLYGTGAVIIRELTLRWRSGWGGVLLLGAAYGIIEEGLAVKSFFDPGWMDLGLFATYGRWLGVNWVWSVFLTVFHAVYSITVPLLLLHVLFPALRGRPLLGKRGFGVCVAVFAGVVLLMYLFLTPYRPDPVSYLLAAAAAALLLAAARLPAGRRVSPLRPVLRPRAFFLAGAAFGFSFFFSMYAVPRMVPYPPVPIIMCGLVCLAAWLFVSRRIGRRFNSPHMVALAAGLLSPMLVTDFILELNGVLGMSVVSLSFTAFLLYLRKKAAGEETVVAS